MTNEELMAQWHELADALGQEALDILAGATDTLTSRRYADPRIVAISLVSRSLSNLRGACLLLDGGLVVEARTLVRSLFENAFWLAGLVKSGESFVNEMLGDEIRSRKSRGKIALEGPGLAGEAADKLRKSLANLDAHWPGARLLNPKHVADGGALANHYLLYAQLSADSAHPSLSSLQRYIGQPEGEVQVLEVAPAPSPNEVIQSWDWACNAMLAICAAINEILGGTPAGEKLNPLGDRYQRLVLSQAS